MGVVVRAGGIVTVLGGVPTAFRPLRHRDFRLLWTGLAISLVGSGLWLVALAWQVIELGGGPTQLSLVTALFSVGLLAFVLIGGVAADRLPQRLVMLAADLIRAAVLLVLGLLSLSGDLRIWHLAVGGSLIGAVAAFFSDLREGFRYVRRTSWLWATLLFALALVLIIIGPLEALLPFEIRDNLGGGAEDY